MLERVSIPINYIMDNNYTLLIALISQGFKLLVYS